MVERLTAFGPHDQDVRTLGDIGFGRALYRTLPEDDFDRQPLIGGGGRYLLVADARIDNREELAEKLALERVISVQLSDAALLLAAWERWQLGALDHILGDLAFAVWDAGEQRLTLGRSPVALKPLFYHSGANFLAFASMPQGLHALSQIPRTIDFAEATAVAARLPHLGTSTIFEGIRMVRHGHAVQFQAGKETDVPLWNLDSIACRPMSTGECGEALRAELDRAVAAQLRRREGPVACQLSSGRDSSAVATSAALALGRTGETLIALTGAPHIGFTGPEISGRLADESGLAARTASRHPNMAHRICRSRPRRLGAELRQLSELHFGPMANLGALHWAAEVQDGAVAAEASIVLIGSTGNFSISASGLSHFVDVFREQGALPWLRQAIRIGGTSRSAWRTIGSTSFGPFLPEDIYAHILKLSGRGQGLEYSVPVLRQPYQKRAEALLRDQYEDARPPRSYIQFRRDMLVRRDSAEKMSLAQGGLDVRDPTGDRRLVELCLSFPPGALVSAASAPSPAYKAAFGDRIPPEVLYNRQRGYQGADWFDLFPKDEVGELFGRFRRNAIVDELLDFDYIGGLIQAWPARATDAVSTLAPYRNELLSALALADYIDLHFPD
jgi:asparagine synthase (glutamine-hydrolysing)